MRLPTAVPAALCLVSLAGCGEAELAPEQQVRDVLTTFAGAAERRDYATICDEVFAPRLLSGLQRIGLPCEVALRQSLGQVRRPRLSVGRIEVEGPRATAEVRTSAEGQAPSTDTLRLERIDGAWKISALSEDAPEATTSATPTATRGPGPEETSP